LPGAEGGGDPSQRRRRRRAGGVADPGHERWIDPARGQRVGDAPGLIQPGIGERIAERVLGVGGVERRQWRVDGAFGRRFALKRDQLGRLLALDPRLHQQANGAGEHVERVGKVRRCALGRRGRVVELVGQAGRHRPERRQPVAIGLPLRDPPRHRAHHGHHAQEHRPVGAHEIDELVWGDDRRADIVAGNHANRRRPADERGDRAHPRGGDMIADRLVAGAILDERLDRPLQDEDKPRPGLVLLGIDGAGGDLLELGVIAPLLQLLVGEPGEEVDRTQVLNGRVAHALMPRPGTRG
jgi:hypothetical protein